MEIRRRYMRLTWNTPYAMPQSTTHTTPKASPLTRRQGVRAGHRGEHGPGHSGLRQDGQEAQAKGSQTIREQQE